MKKPKKKKVKKIEVVSEKEVLISSKLGLTNKYVNLIVDYCIKSGYNL